MGLFIVFEGLDGCGSSTQVKLLTDYLEKNKYSTVMTREPTDGLIGGLIRAALRKEWKTDPMALQLLYTSDRAHHLSTEILPALKKQRIVISDRYFYSTIAFGGASGLSTEWLESINSNFIKPDIVFFLDVPPKECLKRIEGSRISKELFEQEEKLRKVRAVYQELCKKHDFFKRVDGTQSKEDVHAVIIEITKRLLKSKKYDIQRLL